MRDRVTNRIAQLLREHKRRAWWRRVMLVLSCVVVFCTTYALILPGITLADRTYCGAASHTHDASCYGAVLTCEQTHEHTAACYSEALTCGQAEHKHSLACYSDRTADLEEAAQWEKTLPQALTGEWRADLLSVARSQEGYRESAENYAVADSTCYGYTRYGAWSGQPYEPWSTSYAAFCLHYAQVPESSFPRANTCAGWRAALEKQSLYRGAADYTPKVGDVAFLSQENNGEADHVGIVAEVTEDELTVLAGDVDDAVQSLRYARSDTRVLGYGVVPQQPAKQLAQQDEASGDGSEQPQSEITLADTLQITVSTAQGGLHEPKADDDGTYLYYTGESAKTTLKISNPTSEKIPVVTQDDGAVVRLYFRFAKTVPVTGNASADGSLGYAAGDYTVTVGNGHQYEYRVRRIDGDDADHYTYCIEVARPLNGDTMSIDITSMYPSPSSAGGTVEVWGVILDAAQRRAAQKEDGTPRVVDEPEKATTMTQKQTLKWVTEHSDFTTTLTKSGTPTVAVNKEGMVYLSGVSFSRSYKEIKPSLSQSYGRDPVDTTHIGFCETVTLGEGLRFSQAFIDAIQSGDYEYVEIQEERYPNYHLRWVIRRKSDKKELLALIGMDSTTSIPFYDNNTKASFEFTDDNTLEIRYGYRTNPERLYSMGYSFGDEVIEVIDAKAGETYTVEARAQTEHYFKWSAPVTPEAEATTEATVAEDAVKLEKMDEYGGVWERYATKYFGSGTYYTIRASDAGVQEYTGLAFLEDKMDWAYFLSADDIQKIFAQEAETESWLTLTVNNIAICTPDERTVYAADGSEGTVNVAYAGPDAEDAEGKYDGQRTKDRAELTRKAKLTVVRRDGKLQITRSAVEEAGVKARTLTCDLTQESIQAALDELGCVVVYQTTYDLLWDLRQDGKPYTLRAGHPIERTLYCHFKSTFMMLDADARGENPRSVWIDAHGNKVSAYGLSDGERGALLATDSAHMDLHNDYLVREASIAKTASKAEGESARVGEVIEYQVSGEVRFPSYPSYPYPLMPLVDHMSGAQLLLVEAEQNGTADWAKDLERYRDESGKEYCVLSPGTYSHVWVGGAWADSVTVTEREGGYDTVIRWYLVAQYGRCSFKGTYRSLVRVPAGTVEFSVDNICYLSDRESHRLYDILPGWKGINLQHEKRIVSAADLSAAVKEAGAEESVVKAGQTVYYRLRLQAEQVGMKLTLTGADLNDKLPQGLAGALQWEKGNGLTPGTVKILGYEGYETLENGESYTVESDPNVAEQQYLRWGGEFRLTFSDTPVYIYLRLTFPEGASWDTYTAKYNSSSNTFYVFGLPSSVQHAHSVTAQAYLQKGVLQSHVRLRKTDYYYRYQSYDFSDLTQDFHYFQNKTDALIRRVGYYIVLYNAGTTRLYLNEIQDIVPLGFTPCLLNANGVNTNLSYAPLFIDNVEYERNYYGIKLDGVSKSRTYACQYNSRSFVNVSGISEPKWMSADYSVMTEQLSNGQYKLNFTFSQSTLPNTKVGVAYDAARGLCYLEPGQGIQLAYAVNVGSGTETGEQACNRAVMPYYDYNEGGVTVADLDGTFARNKNYYIGEDSKKTEVPNDGSCDLWENETAARCGFSGGDEGTQWLHSEVVQQRLSGIQPGLAKRIVSRTSLNGVVTEAPFFVAEPQDTVTWAIDAYNDGEGGITDYVLTDTMQAPWAFTGNVKFAIEVKDTATTYKEFMGGTLFEFRELSADGKTATIYGYDEQRRNGLITLPVNGEPITLNAYRAYYDENATKTDMHPFQVWLKQDAETGDYTLSIRLPGKEYGIPEQGRCTLTLSTKSTTEQLINSVYVNAAYVTPMAQEWDGTTQHGRVTALDAWTEQEERMSVRASAPVITSYGYATSSDKAISVTDGETTLTSNSNASPNYVVLPDETTRDLTYTLSVYNSDIPLQDLILIDGLPQPGDHTAFQNDDLRFSEFQINLAQSPNFRVQVKAQDGTVTTLTQEQFTVEYSTKTEFDRADWSGNGSGWSKDLDPTQARSFRLRISDTDADKKTEWLMPPNSQISLSFEAKIQGNPNRGEAAWNSFGYHYVANDTPLEAAPLVVGVMMPTVPELQKRLVDSTGAVYSALEDASFRFVLYSGKALTLPDGWTEADLAQLLQKDGRSATTFTLQVGKGKYESDYLMLDAQKVQTFENGAWTDTEDAWQWTNNESYTVVELPPENDLYLFDNIRHNASANGYTFLYQNDQRQRFTATNRVQIWDFTLHKTDASGARSLSGAWFALYSPAQADQLTAAAYDALPEKPAEKPAETLTYDGKTYYLARVAQTKTLNGADGTLTLDALTREHYILQEFRAPAGYVLDATLRKISRSDPAHEVTVVNQGGGMSLPESGGIGLLPYTLGGSLLAAGSLVVGLCRRRRRKGGREQ